MKQTLRIFVRLITLPFVIALQLSMLGTGYAMVTYDWLFETPPDFYSNREHLEYTKKNYKNYWKSFFK